jgi:mannose-6-phosphate isomerase-like protein (cupin superfamily)
MGYTTDFTGRVNINQKVDKSTKEFLNGLASTRRMKRNPEKLAKILGISEEECLLKYGEDAKHYFDTSGNFGQDITDDIVNYNHPPGNYKAASSSDLLDNYVSTPVERPWGRYKQLYLGKGYIVKELETDPGKELSDQFHLHRSEHWIVLSGIGHLKQGATRQMPEREFYVPAGESVYIRPAQTHKLSNPGKTPLKIVEIWAGDILEEDDIIRLDVGPNYGE